MSFRKLLLRLAVRTTIWLGLMALLMFSAAGDWRWTQGWVFIAIFALGSVGFGAWLAKRDPALLAARLEGLAQRGQPLWDRVFLASFMILWLAWLALMALDARRWRRSDMPVSINILGALLVITGFLATMVVFRENSFAAPVVRLQSERNQRVIDTGPYAYVRHPMYAGALLYLIGMPLLLGSVYGLLLVPAFVVGISVRAVFEERLLQRDLPGYAAYMKRVRYRLIPKLW